MPAYVAIDVDVSDMQRYQEYMRLGEATVAAHGGRFLVRGGRPEVLEESWAPSRFVVIEFPDRAAAKRWYASAEYQHARDVRRGVAVFRAIVVDGVAP